RTFSSCACPDTRRLHSFPTRRSSDLNEVDEEDIAATVAKWTGIPVTRLLEGETQKLLQMEQRLAQRVVGQDEAIRAVANAVRRRSEEHTSELQSRSEIVCRLLLEKKNVWFLLPRVARLMIHTPTAISIFVCLSMVQLMAVFISMRCTLCGHFLQVALTLILVVGYAIAAS